MNVNNTKKQKKYIFDDYVTPFYVWEDIIKYIPNDKIIWEPFYCKGLSGEYLTKLGLNVIHTDIDFFNNNEGDIIVSNPPFSKKKEVLTRLKILNKPFILLMPSSTINYQYFINLFKNQIQIIIPKKRISFCKYVNNKLTTTKRCWFDCFYFCYKINLDKDITFL
ncbi:MAG: hypothetical protein GY756_17300 [bacterium]|nr:hypothetical protein [bacterium]